MTTESVPTQSLSIDESLLQKRLPLFPISTTVQGDGAGRLAIGGLDLADLAAAYGTPLYLFDQSTLDQAADEYRSALQLHYPGAAQITLAGKALLLTAAAQWAHRRNLWLDCTGAGELAIAHAGGMPRQHILVHGVNKSNDDLDAALVFAAVIVVDNLSELRRLLARMAGRPEDETPAIWLRVRPGVAVDTHAYRQTGQADSKFGMGLQDAVEAVAVCRAAGVPIEGIHFHQGSHFHDVTPIGPALRTVFDLIEELRDSSGWTPRAISPGGGWGVPYHEDDLPHPSVADYVRFVAETIVRECKTRRIAVPRLSLEPGRGIVARAGVAVYRVGAVKQSVGKRWLLVDGGIADNPRPALYGARYSALPVSAPDRRACGVASIAGPYCESGDILIHDLPIADVGEGELIAVPVSGAYQLGMGSNYNGARRPAVLWLHDGAAHLVQRRETVDDLLRRDLPLP